jgi:hypothetical protein
LKIWLALPTSAVPFITPAVSVKVPETPIPTGLGPAEQRIGVRTAGMALDQNLALEGIALGRVAAGVKQIGIAAEDLAIPEHDHAAALAGTAVLQADVDRIQTVLHEAPVRAPFGSGAASCYAKAGHAASTRQVDRGWRAGRKRRESGHAE